MPDDPDDFSDISDERKAVIEELAQLRVLFDPELYSHDVWSEGFKNIFQAKIEAARPLTEREQTLYQEQIEDLSTKIFAKQEQERQERLEREKRERKRQALKDDISRLSNSAPPASREQAAQDVARSTFSSLTAKANFFGSFGRGSSHSEERAYLLACFAELAYLHRHKRETKAERRAIFCPSLMLQRLIDFDLRLDLTTLRGTPGTLAEADIFIHETERFVYVMVQTRMFNVVVVRGTVFTSLYDWLVNLSVGRRWHRGQKFHRGFYDEALMAAGELGPRIDFAKPTYITGHSLGAAVAGIMHHIWSASADLPLPYLFASPKYAGQIPTNHSYAVEYDLVPMIPPDCFGFENAVPTILPPTSVSHTFWESARYWFQHRTYEPHKVEKYRRLLGDLIGESASERIYLDQIREAVDGYLHRKSAWENKIKDLQRQLDELGDDDISGTPAST